MSVNAGLSGVSCVAHIKPVCLQCKLAVCREGIYMDACVSALVDMSCFDRCSDLNPTPVLSFPLVS